MDILYSPSYPGYIPPMAPYDEIVIYEAGDVVEDKPVAEASVVQILPAGRQVVPGVSKRAIFLKRISLTFAFLAIIFIAYTYGPSVVFYAQGIGSNPEASLTNEIKAEGERKKPSNYQPILNPQLPTENRLSIPSIGVDTAIGEAMTDNYELALKKGVWRVTDFGTASDRNLPFILAAHRFGYLAWTNSYRHYNSFYNLPKVKEGDTVEVIWKQRKYIYEIYGISEGTDVEDYNADLILYTCRDLNSPVRIFRYARLLEI